jgi:hypothetical protein
LEEEKKFQISLFWMSSTLLLSMLYRMLDLVFLRA